MIVLDDGFATGATMIAAMHAGRAKQPTHLLCAAPVASPQCLERVQAYADEFVSLEAPPGFYAVEQFYREFRQVEDGKVIALLARTAPSPEETEP